MLKFGDASEDEGTERRVKVWLSRRRSGYYLLTKAQPKKHPVRGTGTEDFYVPYGDPIGLDNCCPQGVKAIFGIELEIGEQCRATVQGSRY